MKLYYHKTDGGAEYYCLCPIKGTDEGDISTAVIRTDGDEFELFYKALCNLCDGQKLKSVSIDY